MDLDRTVSFTVDLEWCPDEVIADTVALFDEYDVPATLFSTHEDGVDASNHERALHPNFLGDHADEEDILAELANIYPDATGIRSHKLYIYSALREHYSEHGLRYESNYVQYLVDDIEPFWMLGEVLQFPIYFVDDFWLRNHTSHRLPKISTLLERTGLKVFGFHPIHVYLNTPTIEYYHQRREYYEDPNVLRRERSEEPGTRDLLINILEFIANTGIDTYTLDSIHKKYTKSNPYSTIQI